MVTWLFLLPLCRRASWKLKCVESFMTDRKPKLEVYEEATVQHSLQERVPRWSVQLGRLSLSLTNALIRNLSMH